MLWLRFLNIFIPLPPGLLLLLWCQLLGTRFALYVALPSVKTILSDASRFSAVVSLLKRLGFEKVYIENSVSAPRLYQSPISISRLNF